MLSTLMEHLLAADVLLGDQAAMPAAAGGNYTHRAHNVFYLASRLVDKLWQGEEERKEIVLKKLKKWEALRNLVHNSS